MVGHKIIFNTQSDMCGIYLSCASCWPNTCPIGDCHPSSLDNLCESHSTRLYLFADSASASPTASDGVSVICEFQQNGCTVDYQVVLFGSYNTMGRVFVGEERGELLL